MPNLSVAILAKNETDLFEKALKSAKWADEIIVLLDAQHSEETGRIAKKYASQVYTNEFKDFASQKNLLLSYTKNKWVFLLDADEELTDDLQVTITQVIEKEDNTAYRLKRRNYIFGQWIQHTGWYPDKQTRLFQK